LLLLRTFPLPPLHFMDAPCFCRNTGQLPNSLGAHRYHPARFNATRRRIRACVFSWQMIVIGVDDEGREVLLSLLKPGDFFGEVSLIDGRPHSADVVALTNGEALIVRRPDFLALMERLPHLVWQLLQAMAKRLRETDEMVMRMAWLNAPERVAWALLEFADAKGRLPSWLSVNILAKRCGLARETASRIVSQWQREGILQRTRDGWVILKSEKLRSLLRARKPDPSEYGMKAR